MGEVAEAVQRLAKVHRWREDVKHAAGWMDAEEAIDEWSRDFWNRVLPAIVGATVAVMEAEGLCELSPTGCTAGRSSDDENSTALPPS